MSGYIPREREPMTREQVVAIVLSFIAGTLMLFIAFTASRVAEGWLGKIGKIPVGAPVMFILGSTLLIQSNSPPAAETKLPRIARFRRAYAFFLYALGAAMFALPFVFGGQ